MAGVNIELDSQSTGLIIVDMQVEGCERHGPGVKPVIGNIRRFDGFDKFIRRAVASASINHGGLVKTIVRGFLNDLLTRFWTQFFDEISPGTAEQ